MQIEMDNGSGFCFGVTTAIKKAEEELAKGVKLYCLGDNKDDGTDRSVSWTASDRWCAGGNDCFGYYPFCKKYFRKHQCYRWWRFCSESTQKAC